MPGFCRETKQALHKSNKSAYSRFNPAIMETKNIEIYGINLSVTYSLTPDISERGLLEDYLKIEMVEHNGEDIQELLSASIIDTIKSKL